MTSSIRNYHDAIEMVLESGLEVDQPGLIPHYNGYEYEEMGEVSPVIESSSLDHNVIDSIGCATNIHRFTQSQYRFWKYVAFTRNLAQISEIERRTCPMVGCEIPFKDTETMFQHLKICPSFSKGVYRCFESRKEEKIGKCNTEGCLELKGRIASTITSMKRHFSGRSSKSCQSAESNYNSPVSPVALSGVNIPWDGESYSDTFMCRETSLNSHWNFDGKTDTHGILQEKNEFNLPGLNDTQDSVDRVYENGAVSELSTGNNHTYYHLNHDPQSYFPPAELDSSLPLPPAYAPQLLEKLTKQEKRDSEVYLADDGYLEPFTRSEKLWKDGFAYQEPSKIQTHPQQSVRNLPLSFQTSHPIAEQSLPFSHSQQMRYNLPALDPCASSSLVELEAPFSVPVTTYGISQSHTYHSLRTSSGTSSEFSEPQSIFSSVSSFVTNNSSMSSLDLPNPTLDYPSLDTSLPVYTPFFGNADESSMVFEEPEDSEFLYSPAINNYQSESFGWNTGRTDCNGVSIDDFLEHRRNPAVGDGHSNIENSSTITVWRGVINAEDHSGHLTMDTRDRSDIQSYGSGADSQGHNELGVKDSIDPDCYFSSMLSQELQLQRQNLGQSRASVTTPSGAAAVSTPANETPSPHPTTQAYSNEKQIVRQVACRHCKFESIGQDTSNLPRHEANCKSNPQRSTIRPFKCQFTNCRCAYKRKDNLLAHQRLKNHKPDMYECQQLGFNPKPSSLGRGTSRAERRMKVRRAEQMLRF